MSEDNNIIIFRSQIVNDNKNDILREVDSKLSAEIKCSDHKTKGKSKPMRAQAKRLSSAIKTRFATTQFISGIACLALAFLLWTTFWLLPETLDNLNMPAIKLALGVTTIFLVVSAMVSALRIRKIHQTTFKEI